MFPGGKVEVVGSTTFLATEQYKGHREVNFPILSLQLNQTSKAEAKLLSRKQKTDQKQRMEKTDRLWKIRPKMQKLAVSSKNLQHKMDYFMQQKKSWTENAK